MVYNERPLRICLLSREYPPDTAWGGIATYTHSLAHGLVEAGHHVDVISLSLDQEEYIQVDRGVQVHRIKPSRVVLPLSFVGLPATSGMLSYSLRASQRLRQLMKTTPYDVVEAPAYFAEGLACSWDRKASPLVVRLYTSTRQIALNNATRWTLDIKFACCLEKLAVERADLLLANSQYSAGKVAHLYGVTERPIHITSLGVRLPKLAPRDRGYSTNGPDPRVLFVGRLSQRKGTDTLLRAIPPVLKRLPEAKFIIVGRDRPTAPGGRYYQEYFEEEVATTTERQAVAWRGFVSDKELARNYQTCSFVVAPSLYETFGYVHLEAMAYGKPIIACRSSATPELVEHGIVGLLVEPDNEDALAQAIIRLLGDEALCRRMGRAARQQAQRFTIEKMVAETVAAYRQVAARSVPGKECHAFPFVHPGAKPSDNTPSHIGRA